MRRLTEFKAKDSAWLDLGDQLFSCLTNEGSDNYQLNYFLSKQVPRAKYPDGTVSYDHFTDDKVRLVVSVPEKDRDKAIKIIELFNKVAEENDWPYKIKHSSNKASLVIDVPKGAPVQWRLINPVERTRAVEDVMESVEDLLTSHDWTSLIDEVDEMEDRQEANKKAEEAIKELLKVEFPKLSKAEIAKALKIGKGIILDDNVDESYNYYNNRRNKIMDKKGISIEEAFKALNEKTKVKVNENLSKKNLKEDFDDEYDLADDFDSVRKINIGDGSEAYCAEIYDGSKEYYDFDADASFSFDSDVDVENLLARLASIKDRNEKLNYYDAVLSPNAFAEGGRISRDTKNALRDLCENCNESVNEALPDISDEAVRYAKQFAKENGISEKDPNYKKYFDDYRQQYMDKKIYLNPEKNKENRKYYLDKDLKEAVADSMPAEVLPTEQVKEFILNLPEATPNTPPRFFKLGYINELSKEIPAKFRGGRGSEGQPFVRIFKCTEYSALYTGADWRGTNATKAADKVLGTERHTGEKTGFSFNGDEEGTVNRIGRYMDGSEALQAYIADHSKQKVKFFISLDDEDLHEASREEVAQYLTPAMAAKILTPGSSRVAAGQDAEGNNIYDKPINRFKLSKIYMIGNLGHSIM